jgi:hypothetical protein
MFVSDRSYNAEPAKCQSRERTREMGKRDASGQESERKLPVDNSAALLRLENLKPNALGHGAGSKMAKLRSMD